jgi:hypothetical protein
MNEYMNEQMWSIDGKILTWGKPKYSEKQWSKFHFGHHKFHME